MDDVLIRIERRLAAVERKPSGGFGWRAVLVASVLVIIAIVVGWFVLNRHNAELARLRAEKFNAELDAEERKLHERVLASDLTTQEAKDEAEEALASADASAARLTAAEETHAATRARIAALRSWRDLSAR